MDNEMQLKIRSCPRGYIQFFYFRFSVLSSIIYVIFSKPDRKWVQRTQYCFVIVEEFMFYIQKEY